MKDWADDDASEEEPWSNRAAMARPSSRSSAMSESAIDYVHVWAIPYMVHPPSRESTNAVVEGAGADIMTGVD